SQLPMDSGSSAGAALPASSSSAQRSSNAASSAGVRAGVAQPKSAYIKLAWAAVAIVVVALAAAIPWFAKRRTEGATTTASQKTLAVLPLQNLGADKDIDYLRLALADEIATSLSYVPALTIRPFATTSKYDSPTLDLQEAVDVENNRTLWRDTMTVAAPDMIAMRGEITAKVRQGLVPALGAGRDSSEGATHPKNEEAYDLYLRSVSLPHDPLPNKDAIAMLERAVGLDPAYAPAWAALGIRYHYDGAYSNGGSAALQRADGAFERSLALDPNYMSPAAELMLLQVERGELVKAYQRGKALLAQHPENANLHFALAYVLRYGGAAEESGHECDTALSLDPGNYAFRSCVLTFDQLGDYARGLVFLQLDAGSTWSDGNLMRHDIREGKLTQALELARRADIQPMIACLEDPSSA